MQAWFGAGNVNVSQTVSGNQTLFWLTFVGQDAGTSMAPVQLGALTGASYSEACTIAFPYQPFAGSWTISYNNGTTTQTTGTLAASATPTQVASALNGLSNLGTGAVSVTTSGNAYTYAITFNAGYFTNLGNFVVNTSSLEPTLIPTISVTTGSGSAINVLGSAGTNSVQQITLDNSVTGFEIAYDSLVTGSVANNTANPTTTAAAIQAALGALSGIGVNNVAAIASSTTSSQTVYTVSFQNMLGGANIGQIGLTAITGAYVRQYRRDDPCLLGGGRPAHRELDDHLQQRDHGSMAAIASRRPAAATEAASLQNALNSLGSIGGEGGSVSVTTVGNAWTYKITFNGDLAKTGLPLIVNINNLTGTSQRVAVATRRGHHQCRQRHFRGAVRRLADHDQRRRHPRPGQPDRSGRRRRRLAATL